MLDSKFEILSKLEAVGFTPLEAKIYLFILKKGKVSAATIHESLHLDKSSTYRILENFVNRGFISAFGTDYGKEYAVSDTNRIIEKIHEEGIKLRSAESSLSTFFSQLETSLLKDYKRHNIQLYEGIDGVKIIWEKRLEAKNKLIREIANSKTLQPHFPDFIPYMSDYVERRVGKGIFLRGLVPEESINELDKSSEEYLKEIRILPKSKDFIATVTTFDNITAFHNLKGKRLIGVVIVDEFITNLVNYMFDQLWENARKSQESLVLK